MPIYWNCHDLAIRLAYILVRPSVDVIKMLKKLTLTLHQACGDEINLGPKVVKAGAGGWGAAVLGGFAGVPPLAMAGAGVFLIGWSVRVFGGLAILIKQRTRHQFMIKLEEKFPQLKSLHN
jgi:hypothetical protein